MVQWSHGPMVSMKNNDGDIYSNVSWEVNCATCRIRWKICGYKPCTHRALSCDSEPRKLWQFFARFKTYRPSQLIQSLMVSFSLKDHICIHFLDNPAQPGQIKNMQTASSFRTQTSEFIIILCLFLEMVLNMSMCTNHVTWKTRIIVHKRGEQLQK